MRYQLTIFDRVCVGSIALRFNKYSDGFYEFRHEDSPEFIEVFGQAEFDEMTKRTNYRFERNYYAPENKKARAKGLIEQISSFRTEEQKSLLFRYALCKSMDHLFASKKLLKTDAAIKAARAEIWAGALEVCSSLGVELAPSEYCSTLAPRTLRTYYQDYVRGGRSLMLLCDGRRKSKPFCSGFDPETERFLQKHVRKFAEKYGISPSKVVEETTSAFKKENQRRMDQNLTLLTIPSRSTIEDRLSRLDPYEIECVYLGKDATRKKYANASIGLPILAPLERVEFDAVTADVETFLIDLGLLDKMPDFVRQNLPKGRRYILLMIDVATRCILAIKIAETPSTDDLRQLLKQVFVDKSELASNLGAKSSWHMCGTPNILAGDTAAHHISTVFLNALAGLGIQAEFGAVGVPELRGTMERVFRTGNQNVMTKLPGRTFGSIDERRKLDPVDNVCLTDDDLTEILILWIVDYYHHKPQGGLGGQTPYNAWKEKTGAFGICPPPGREQITVHLGEEFERTLHKTGLRLFALNYSCSELRKRFMRTKERKYTVRVNPDDIRFVMVWIEDHWARADFQHPDLPFTTLYEWEYYCKELKQKFSRDAEIDAVYLENAQNGFSETISKALKRMGISPRSYTSEQIQRLEKQLFQGINFSEEVEVKRSSDPSIPFGEVIDQPVNPSLKPMLDDVDNENDIFNPDISQWKLEDE